jgi:hypothetical protein
MELVRDGVVTLEALDTTNRTLTPSEAAIEQSIAREETMTSRITKTIAHLTLAFAAAATVTAATPSAQACGGGWFADPQQELEWREQGIARAEKELNQGKYDQAAGTVLRVIPHIGKYTKAPKDKVVQRAIRVLAVATARKDGKPAVDKQVPSWAHDFVAKSFFGDKDADRAANLTWAATNLESLRAEKKDDPVLESEIGELLAKIEGRQDQARKILEKLADKDLLTSPEAYKALASLRAAAGDKDGRVAALERCKAMAKDATVCTSRS